MKIKSIYRLCPRYKSCLRVRCAVCYPHLPVQCHKAIALLSSAILLMSKVAGPPKAGISTALHLKENTLATCQPLSDRGALL